LLLAERQVHIIGWDIHSETPLVGPSGRVDDGLPIALGPFLKELLLAKPELRINILVWDFAALYAAEREWNSADKFTAGCGGRIRFCLDSSLPLGSSQHQKIVVIDNAIAFSGGLDLTIRRWDTSEHLAEHPLRRDPDGKPYPPFHDVQCMVEGEAAVALGEIALGGRLRNRPGRSLARLGAAGDKADPGRHRANRVADRIAGGNRRSGPIVRGFDQYR
jgi:phospholipase D1/2